MSKIHYLSDKFSKIAMSWEGAFRPQYCLTFNIDDMKFGDLAK